MIEAQRIIPLFVPPVGDNIEGLLHEIRELSGKLQEAGRQSFYFQLGISSNKDKLKRLAMKYENYRALVNGNSAEYFLLQLIEARGEAEKARKRCRKRPNMINRMVLSACEGEVKELRVMYEAKRKFITLPALPGGTSILWNKSAQV